MYFHYYLIDSVLRKTPAIPFRAATFLPAMGTPAESSQSSRTEIAHNRRTRCPAVVPGPARPIPIFPDSCPSRLALHVYFPWVRKTSRQLAGYPQKRPFSRKTSHLLGRLPHCAGQRKLGGGRESLSRPATWCCPQNGVYMRMRAGRMQFHPQPGGVLRMEFCRFCKYKSMRLLLFCFGGNAPRHKWE